MNTIRSGADPALDPAAVENAIFDAAMNIDDATLRAAFLSRSFHGDPGGKARMEDLIAHAGESSAFFIETGRHSGLLAQELIRDLPGSSDPPIALASEGPESKIGRYQLKERIGEGGCGVVYEAEQQEPVKRRVALKVIRFGMDTENVIARFEMERQALALMDHPNIARVLDAGTTAEGRPYFVMELVKGDRITTYCDQEKLGIEGRLGIFIQVCHAIQHAHQKGIIHRDIKPSNILVATHDGISLPKVIDFGIAKATGNHVSGRAMATAWDQMIGTPAYMSPEQIDMGGIDIDTRGDVYSLGALLYELLAGRPPFDGEELMKIGMSEMRRTLLDKNPPRPSSLLLEAGEWGDEAAANRGCEKSRLISKIRGDLDWVVMKAMDKDRNRRYQTVNGLAMDLKHYLANEPVIARRPGRVYLLGKFFRRNRIACISGIAAGLSLVGGLSMATTLYLRERVALSEQERLRQEAEAAGMKETKLRAQAQARANVSRVAVLLSEGKVTDADLLLQESPLDSIEPSREAADVYRSLGAWNAIYGRWPQAVQCFTLLNQANRLDHRVVIAEGFDLIMTAPTFLEAGDPAGYEMFRRMTLDHHLPVATSLSAEHLLKVCLLSPADADVMNRLKPVADICASADPLQSGRHTFPEWNAFSLALYQHRLGNQSVALQWGEKCLSYPDPSGTRIASMHALEALIHYRSGSRDLAAVHLQTARSMIPAIVKPTEEGQRQPPGYWFAWSVARILVREADGLIGR
jgi:serine/threonine protein kinase